jgi:predicted nucleic acid-binding protein
VGWVDALRGKTVGLDTAPLIYFIEQSPGRIEKLRPFFAAAGRGEFRLTTSFVTLVEVLVQPLRNGRVDIAHAYRDILLRSPALRAVPLDKQVAEEAARLRAVHSLRTPDAIQVATAVQSGASHFLTNDAALAQISGITVLLLDALPET